MPDIKAKDATAKKVNAKKSIANVSTQASPADKAVNVKIAPTVSAKTMEILVPTNHYP